MPNASMHAAIAAAAHATLIELMPAAKSTFDAALDDALRAIPNSAAKSRGIQVGRKAAAAILAARKNDGSNRTVTREPGTKPGEYRPTPPDFTPAWFAHWASVTPFVLRSPVQFRPVPPPAVASAQQLGVHENARLFALVNLAMADGFIGGFEAKYHYNYWRPATAIRAAGDKEWLSYLITPPVPDYPSTHTVLGAAAAAVMKEFFGTDLINFTMTSGAPYPGLTREFWSFSAAARENGASRVFAGIHFSTAVNAGYLQGSQIGAWVFAQALRPMHDSPSTSLSPEVSTSLR